MKNQVTTSYASAMLYDGGWRASDKDELMEEYGLTDEEAETLCNELAELGKSGANVWL